MAQVATRKQKYPAWAKPQAALTDEAIGKTAKAVNPLDSEKEQEQFRKLQEWWLQARESQSFVRIEMDVDESFYHGDQFTDEDRRALEAVGQAPLVFNKTKPVIDWLVGTERRTRVDFKILPRKKGTEKDAQVKTDVMKYIVDVSKAQFARSEAAKEAFMSGLGWIEVGVRRDAEEEPIYIRQESWRNMWYDPLGTAKDTSDWRFLFRSKWTDLDIAQAMFPDRAMELQAASTSVNIDLTTKDDDEYYVGLRFSHRDRAGNMTGIPSYTDVVNTQVNNRRQRVRLVEAWYRMPVKAQKVKGGRHHGRIVNLKNQRMMFELSAEIEKGTATVYDSVVMQVRCAVFCENTLLQNMDSPYHHNRFPFIPIFAYRKGKFHEPYGVVRNCRDPQEDLNKRYSKALFLLSSTRVIADRNAVQDWESLREEVGRPDAQLLLDTPKARFEVHTEQALAEEQVKLMLADGMHIQEGAGVTSENLGHDTNAISGKAVLAKQTQGSVVSAELFDNLRYANQIEGEIVLSLAEQFMDQAKAIRITGAKGAISWHEINGADGTNDITATQMDYVVSEQDFRDTQRQAMFDSLTDMVSKMNPEIALKLLDVIVDLSDFPNKQDLINRILSVNGMKPTAEEMTPAQEAAWKQAQQAQQAAEALKQKAVALEFGEKQAKIDKTNAEAALTKAEIPTVGADGGQQGAAAAAMAKVQAQSQADAAALAAQRAKDDQAASNRAHEIDVHAQTAVQVANINARAEEASENVRAAATITVAKIAAGASVDSAAHAATATDANKSLKSQADFHKSERARAEQETAATQAAAEKDAKAAAEKSDKQTIALAEAKAKAASAKAAPKPAAKAKKK